MQIPPRYVLSLFREAEHVCSFSLSVRDTSLAVDDVPRRVARGKSPSRGRENRENYIIVTELTL